MGEINSDDDESSDDTFDGVHNVTCGNVDGCSGMDEADDYDSEHLRTKQMMIVVVVTLVWTWKVVLILNPLEM